MKAVVMYESMFGNTRAVAEAIGAGLGASWHVIVGSVAGLGDDALTGSDLVVAGGPTHVHGMSQPRTRLAAKTQAAEVDALVALEPNATSPGLREWFQRRPAAPTYAAAFDTRVAMSPVLGGRASPKIARSLQRLGCQLLARPESFLVTRRTTQLLPGELDRAFLWGRQLSEAIHHNQKVSAS